MLDAPRHSDLSLGLEIVAQSHVANLDMKGGSLHSVRVNTLPSTREVQQLPLDNAQTPTRSKEGNL